MIDCLHSEVKICYTEKLYAVVCFVLCAILPELHTIGGKKSQVAITVQLSLNPNLDGYKKKCIAVRLGIIYDFQATNRKQGGLPVRAPIPPTALLVVTWELYVTPSRPEYTKKPPQSDGSF
jgi:hypothetical protein